MRKLLEYQTVNLLQGLQDWPGKNNIASRFKELFGNDFLQDFHGFPAKDILKVCS